MNLRLGACAALAVLVLGAAPALAWDPFETTHGDVDDGNALLRAGKAGEAVAAYEAARKDIPEQPELHFDLGLAQFALKDYGASVGALERALERVEGPFKGVVLYALGTAYAAWGGQTETSEVEEDRELALGRWEKAAHYLERTLRLVPDHEGALRNLELALLRIDPPCSARDDEYEPNGGAGDAKPVPFPEGERELDVPLRLCAEDEDWFTVAVQPGDRLSTEVTTSTKGASLGLSLLTPDGGLRLRPPDGATEAITRLAYSEATEAGDLRLRVANLAEEETDYRLKVRLLPACERLEDELEDNDEPARARAVSQAEAEKMGQLRLCPQDDDWFVARLGEGDSLVALAQFQVEKGTPSLAITDLSGRVLAERSLPTGEAAKKAAGGAQQGGAPLILTLLEPPAGSYLVRVSGTLDVEAAYGLQLQVLPPCPDGDDGEEENDEHVAAKPLQPPGGGAAPGGGGGGGGGPKLLRACAGDDDFFQVSAKKDQRQVVTIAFDHARGDLDLALFPGDDPSAAPLAESDSSSDEVGGEGVALPPVEEEGSFVVRVRAKAGESNFYLLNVTSPQDQGGDDRQQDEEKKPEEEQGPDEPEEQERSEEQQPDKPEEQEPPEPREPMEDEMDQLDGNPRNLEAERARDRSPFRHTRPTRPW